MPGQNGLGMNEMFYDLQGVVIVLVSFFVLAYIMIKIADNFDKKKVRNE